MPASLLSSVFYSLDLSELAKAAKKKLQAVSVLYIYLTLQRIIQIIDWSSFLLCVLKHNLKTCLVKTKIIGGRNSQIFCF